MKKTTDGKWVHVICALFTDGVKFLDTTRMEPVDISGILDKIRSEKCVICTTTKGICCKCSKPECQNWIHITCSQKNNCLQEVANKINDKLAFLAYCAEHKPTESRRISSIFVREKQRQINDSFTFDDGDSIDVSGTIDYDDSKEVSNASVISDANEENYSIIANNSKNGSDSDDPKEASNANDSGDANDLKNSDAARDSDVPEEASNATATGSNESNTSDPNNDNVFNETPHANLRAQSTFRGKF